MNHNYLPKVKKKNILQEGEKIDFTWINYQTKSDDKVLKIRAATLDDAGTIVCKGINGFGKAQVNIELIVIGIMNFKCMI